MASEIRSGSQISQGGNAALPHSINSYLSRLSVGVADAALEVFLRPIAGSGIGLVRTRDLRVLRRLDAEPVAGVDEPQPLDSGKMLSAEAFRNVMEAAANPEFTHYTSERLQEKTGMRLKGISDRELAFLAEHCSDLAWLQLSECPGITEEGLRALPSLPKLRWLYLDDCAQMASLDWIPPLMQWQELSVIHCKNLDNIDAVQQLTQLTALDLSGCENVTKIDAVHGCVRLEKLNLAGLCCLETLTRLDKLIALRELNLAGCNRIERESFNILTLMDSLQELSLASCDLKDLEFIRGLPRLTRLDLSFLPEQTSMTALERLVDLTQLDLSNCLGLSDVSAIGQCKQLQWLSLCGCKNVTDIEPLRTLSRLEALMLTDCDQIECFGVLQRLQTLRWLDLAGCSQITSDQLLALQNSLQLDEKMCFAPYPAESGDRLESVFVNTSPKGSSPKSVATTPQVGGGCVVVKKREKKEDLFVVVDTMDIKPISPVNTSKGVLARVQSTFWAYISR